MDGLSHIHKRKMSSKQRPSAIHQSKLVHFVDSLAYLSVIVPILTIPQFITIFVHHDASDLSLVTWGTYLISAAYWTYYGWLHKEAPIWFPNMLMVCVDLGVVVGILLYK